MVGLNLYLYFLAETYFIAQSDKMKIRFIHDRNDFFLDISSIANQDLWAGSHKILGHLRKIGKIKADYKCTNKIMAVRKFLNQYYAMIKNYIH